jgi:hypothetical protein
MPSAALHGLRPGERAAHRLRGFLVGAEPEVELDDVLAFDTRTREWTVLLERIAAQPSLP